MSLLTQHFEQKRSEKLDHTFLKTEESETSASFDMFEGKERWASFTITDLGSFIELSNLETFETLRRSHQNYNELYIDVISACADLAQVENKPLVLKSLSPKMPFGGVTYSPYTRNGFEKDSSIEGYEYIHRDTQKFLEEELKQNSSVVNTQRLG